VLNPWLKDRPTWWTGVALVTGSLLFHAAFPRYEWRSIADAPQALIRLDRWTGRAETGYLRADWGRWVSTAEFQRDQRKKGTAASQLIWNEIDAELRKAGGAAPPPSDAKRPQR
jgi:hypothetical protein